MAEIPPLEEIEELLSSFDRALHPRELASRLEIPPEQYSSLIAALDLIERDGRLKLLPGGRVQLIEGRRKPKKSPKKEGKTAQRAQRITGKLSVHPRGFGFVTAADHDDVFIPPDSIFEALHGDTVEVTITGKSPKGYEGQINSVVSRRDRRVPGVLRKKGKSSWLEPDDSRLRGPLVIADAKGARDGDAVVVEITTFPHFADELPEAKLLEVLGRQGDPQTEVRKILIRESVSEEHSAEALKNAEQMATRLGSYRLGKRRDLRHVPLPTIDPEDARDHDDALWVERNGRGYTAYIAIADVSEYVRPESALDEEARERGCTIYLPDRAIPMLPRALAGDLCSLVPERDRFCLCVIAELDHQASCKSFEIVEGLMRSAAKLTYAGVARTLGFDDESKQSPQADAYEKDLRVLAELAAKLRKNRMNRGALDLDLPEARVVIDDETGAPTEVKKRATRPGLRKAYSLVEEMMLLANELVAQWLVDKDAPGIFRIHDAPDEEKLERLAKITKNLSVHFDLDDLTRPGGASRFLKSIAKHERKPVLEMLLLRSLKQAVYDTNNIGHFGLASEKYVHFTSPIRRYPDLRVHRQIKHILRGGKIDGSDQAKDDLQKAAVESSKKERAAMDVEREVMDLYRTIYMKAHIGDEFEGRVTGMSGGGLYLSIDDPCVDVMVPFDALGPDIYETDEDELGVVGSRSGEHIMFGDTLTIVIQDTSIERRTVYAARPKGDDDEVHDDDDWKDSPRARPGTLPRGRSGKVFPSSYSERSGSRGRRSDRSDSARTQQGSDGRRTRKSFKPGDKKKSSEDQRPRGNSRALGARASSSRSGTPARSAATVSRASRSGSSAGRASRSGSSEGRTSRAKGGARKSSNKRRR